MVFTQTPFQVLGWIALRYVLSEHCIHTLKVLVHCDSHILFVCFDKKCAGKPVPKQHLFHWIVDTISQAYSSQDLPIPGDLVAHSIRSMATSYTYVYVHMCATAFWSTPCMFTRFYRINVTNPNSLGSAVLSTFKLPEKGNYTGPL